MNTINVNKQDILNILGLATYDTILKVPNKYAKEQLLVQTTEGVFNTSIDIKGVFIKTKRGCFNTTFELIQLKVYTNDNIIFLGETEGLLNSYFYEIFLSEKTTVDIPNGVSKTSKIESIRSIISRMKSIKGETK